MLRNKAPLAMLFAIVLCVSFYVGCGEYDAPLSTASVDTGWTSPGDLTILSRSGLSGDPELSPRDDCVDGCETSDYVDSKGGKVKLDFVTIDIPKNAIPTQDGEVEVSISITDPSVYAFNLGPDGYQFDESVTITVKMNHEDVNGVDTSSLRFYYFDDGAGQWEEVGGTYNSKGNKISVETNHFSYWAIASD